MDNTLYLYLLLTTKNVNLVKYLLLRRHHAWSEVDGAFGNIFWGLIHGARVGPYTICLLVVDDLVARRYHRVHPAGTIRVKTDNVIT